MMKQSVAMLWTTLVDFSVTESPDPADIWVLWYLSICQYGIMSAQQPGAGKSPVSFFKDA